MSRTVSQRAIYVFVLMAGLLLPGLAWAQADNDFRSAGPGPANWTTAASWQRYNAATSSWVTATYWPGQGGGANLVNDVTIQAGHTIEVRGNIDPADANQIASLTVDGTLLFGTATGTAFTLVIEGPAGPDGNGNVGEVTISATGTVGVFGTSTSLAHNLHATGTVTINGAFNGTPDATRGLGLTLSNSGTALSEADRENPAIARLIQGSGTANLQFLTINNNSGTWELRRNLTIRGALTMNDGGDNNETLLRFPATGQQFIVDVGGNVSMSSRLDMAATGTPPPAPHQLNIGGNLFVDDGTDAFNGVNTLRNGRIGLAGNVLDVTFTGAGVAHLISGASTIFHINNLTFQAGTGTVTVTAAELDLYGNLTQNNVDLDATGGVIQVNGATQAIGGAGNTGQLNFFNLAANANGTRTVNREVFVRGNYTVLDSVAAAGGGAIWEGTFNITLQGDYANNSGEALPVQFFPTTTGRLVLNGAAQTIAGVNSWRALDIGQGGSNTTATVVSGTQTLVAGGTITIDANAILSLGTSLLTVTDNPAQILGPGTLEIAPAGAPAAFTAGFFAAPIFTNTGATGGTLRLNGTAAYTIPTGFTTLQNLVVTNTVGAIALGHSLALNRSLTVEAGAVLNATAGTITLTGDNSNITVNGTTTLTNLTLNKNSGNDVTLAGVLRVNGALTWQGANPQRFFLASGSELRLGPAATISDGGTAFSATRMIVSDGSSATGSRVARLATAVTSYNAFTIPLGTVGAYSPVTFNSVTATVSGGEASISVKPVLTSASAQSIERQFYVSSANLSAVTNANFTFNYVSSDDDAPFTYTGAAVRRYDGLAWQDVTGSSVNSGARTFTTGTTNTAIGERYAVLVSLPRTWYTYRPSGDWNDPNVWTLDPSGLTRDNPGSTFPNNGDVAVILNNKQVTLNFNNLDLGGLSIQNGGSVTIPGTVTGTSLGQVSGQGRLVIPANNLPAADFTAFVQASTGGTIEYTGAVGSINLPSSLPTYNNLIVNLANNTDVLVQTGNMTLNGSLTINRGTWQVNNNTSTTALDLTIAGNVTLEADGRLRVGQGNVFNGFSLLGSVVMPALGQYHYTPHRIRVSGDFTNRGSVRLTNQARPYYNQFAGVTTGLVGAEATDNVAGAATLIFQGQSNNTFLCAGETRLYGLVILKGTDRTFTLTLNSTAVQNFELFGPVTAGRNEAGAFANGDVEVRKSLWIHRGTLRLQGNLRLWSLSETGQVGGGNGDYAIGRNGVLWVDGANVQVFTTTTTNVNTYPNTGLTVDGYTYPYNAVGFDNSGSHTALSIYGGLRVSAGLFSTRNSAGVITWATADAFVEVLGGIVDASQWRVGGGGSGNSSLIMRGGVLQVRDAVTGEGGAGGAALLSLPDAGSSFTMSGGRIDIASGSGGRALVEIGISATNANVTGGTMRFLLNNSSNNTITTTATLPGLEFRRYRTTPTRLLDYQPTGVTPTGEQAFGSGSIGVVLSSAVTTAGTNASVSILEDVILNANNNNVSVGGDFIVGSTTGSNASYVGGTNTTTLAGAFNSTITVANTTASPALTFNNLTIAKTGAAANDNITLTSTGRTAGTQPVQVAGNLTITTGDLSLGNFALGLTGDAAVADTLTGTGAYNESRLLLNGTANQSLSGSGSYRNVEVNKTTGTPVLASNLTLTGDFFLNTATLFDANIYSLTVGGVVRGNAGGTALADFGETRHIQFAGNNSDGGLIYPFATDGTRFYPVGTNGGGSGRVARFTPVNLVVAGGTQAGAVLRVNPVAVANPALGGQGQLSSLNTAFDEDALSFYWRVRRSGFSANPTISAGSVFYYQSDDIDADATATASYVDGTATPGTWVFGRVQVGVAAREDLSAVSTTATGAPADPRTITVSGAGFALAAADGYYTVGIPTKFTGNVLTYFSRGDGAWDTPGTWNRSDLMTPAQLADPHIAYVGTASSNTPTADDFVQIGYTPSNGRPHEVVLSPTGQATRTVAGLTFFTAPTPTRPAGFVYPFVVNDFFDQPTLNFFQGGGDDEAGDDVRVTLNAGPISGQGLLRISFRSDDENVENVTGVGEPALVGPVGATGTDLKGIYLNADFGDFVNQPLSEINIVAVNEGNGARTPESLPLLNQVHTIPSWMPQRYARLSIVGGLRYAARVVFPAAWGTTGVQVTGGDATNPAFRLEGGADVTLGTNLTISGNVLIENDPEPYLTGISFPTTGNHTLSIGGNLRMRTTRAAIYVDSTTTGTGRHRILLGGNYQQEGGLGLRLSVGNPALDPAAYAYATLEFTGTATSTFAVTGGHAGGSNPTYPFDLTGNATSTIAQTAIVPQLVMNKTGAGSMSINANTIARLPGSNATATKPLVLTSGNLILNHPGLNFNVISTTTNGAQTVPNFVIPQAATLTVTQGRVGASRLGAITGNAGVITSLVQLDGALVVNGGTVDLQGDGGTTATATTTANNINIEYGSTGTASINVSSGTLSLAGQIRRNAANNNGVLRYTQSGGTVNLATRSATTATRAVLDITNTGSQFTWSGGNINVFRSASSSIPTVLLDAQTMSVTGSGALNFLPNPTGPTIALQNMGLLVASGNALPTVNVGSATLLDPDAVLRLYTNAHTIGSLTVNNGSTFDQNGNALTITSALSTATGGTFTAGTSTTTFSGTTTITGSALPLTLNNVVVTGGTSTVASTSNLSLSGTLTINTGATLALASNRLTLLGSTATINGALTSTGAAAGLVLEGTTPQTMAGTGSATRVVVNNAQNVTQTAASFTITGASNSQLVFVNGNYILGVNGLTLGAATTVTNPAANRTIIVAGAVTDQGLTRELSAGALPTSIVFPLGVGSGFTPVEFRSTTGTAAAGASIRVSIGNDFHPTVQAPRHVLGYYYRVNAANISGVTTNLTFTYNPADVNTYSTAYEVARIVTGPPFTNFFLPNSNINNTGTAGLIPAYSFQFNHTGAAAADITSDYTMGVPDDVLTPTVTDIPRTTPEYVFTGVGNWDDNARWSPVGPVPNGVRVRFASGTATLNSNNKQVFATTIDAGATLLVTNSDGHNFNLVSGGGTLELQLGPTIPVPAGNYTSFLGTATSLIRYSGTENYPLPAGVFPTYPNLEFAGTGTKTLPSGDLVVNGATTITGGTVDFNSGNTARLRLNGNLTYTGGTLTMEPADEVSIEGAGSRTISGSFTVSNLALRRTSASDQTTITGGTVEVSNSLIFQTGQLTTSTNNFLRFGSTATYTGHTGTTFINGPAQRVVSSGVGVPFTFPFGFGGTTRELQLQAATNGTWTGQFVRGGLPPLTVQSPLSSYVTGEYYELFPPVGGSAQVGLTYSSNTGINPPLQPSDLTFLRVARRVPAPDPSPRWELAPSSFIGGTTSAGTVRMSSSQTILSPNAVFAVGAESISLPVTWLYVRADRVTEGARVRWGTAAEENNHYFEVERSSNGGRNWQRLGQVMGSGTSTIIREYQFVDNQLPSVDRVLYRIRQVDLDGRFRYSNTVELPLNIQSEDAGDQWQVVPNPNIGSDMSLVVIGRDVDPLRDLHQVVIVGMNGRVMFRGTDRLGNLIGRIQSVMGNAPAGVYVVTLMSGNHTQSLRFVKTNY